jgi:opacity protein-like surface antigen
MPRGTAPLAVAAAVAAALAAAASRPAAAQELDPEVNIEGKVLSATISQRFEADSNYDLDDPSPGTSYFADTRVNLGFLNQTDTQTFRLGIDTGLRALWQAEEDFKFTIASPTTASVGYVNEWASGIFDAALTFRERRVDYIESLEDFVTDEGALPDDLDQLQGDSYELRYDANVGVAFATDSPSSYALRFLGTKIDYTEDTPNQAPRTTLEVQGDWTLDLSPVFSSIVSADYLTYDADNATDTSLRISSIDAGVIYTPNEQLVVGAGIGYADRKREDTDADGVRETTQSNNGPLVRGDFRYTLENLILRGNAAYTTAAPDPQFSGNIVGTYRLPRGQVRGRIFQNYTATKSGGNQARVTGASLGLVRDLNSISRLSVDFAVAHQQDVDTLTDTAREDIDRLTATATYSYDLTEAVSADIGYRFRSRQQDPTDAQSNAVFFQIGRTFETIP